MKMYSLKMIIGPLLFSLALLSCNKEKGKEMENHEESRVGKVYDTAQQGIRHENINNQFPSSRNDNKKTVPLTAGKSDTTVNKADTLRR